MITALSRRNRRPSYIVQTDAPAPAEAAGYEHDGEWSRDTSRSGWLKFLAGWLIFAVLVLAQWLMQPADEREAKGEPPGPSLISVLVMLTCIGLGCLLALHFLLRLTAP